MMKQFTLLLLLSFALSGKGATIEFQGKADDNSLTVAWENGRLLNQTLQSQISDGDTLLFPFGKVFHLMGGIKAWNLTDVTIDIQGELMFSDSYEEWPRVDAHDDILNAHAEKVGDGEVLHCLTFYSCRGLTFTSSGSSGNGILNGNGARWWNMPLVGYLRFAENRPRLLQTEDCNDTIVENLTFLDSPYWTTSFKRVNGLIIRNSVISARRTRMESHGILDLSAFNTDGFDFTGRNIHVHDCNVWCQDDAIAIKDDTQNVLVERVNASGMGLTIGSIGSSVVRNVTFRDSYIRNTVKGIYMKFRHGVGLIEDVTYENIRIDGASQYPIWIGVAQQSDTRDLCYANPCSICFPYAPTSIVPGAICEGSATSVYRNIVLKDITINSPSGTPGVIIGGHNSSGGATIEGITFDNVKLNDCGEFLGDFEDSFPNSPTDIYDPYVTDLILLIVGGIVLLVLFPCVGCWKCGCCTGQYWKEHPRTKISVGVVTAVLGITGLVLVSWLIHINGQLGDSSKYFLCDGVVGGVATGNTYPVPHCFEDQTTSSEPDDCGLSGGLIALIVILCLLFTAGLTVLLLKRKRPEIYKKVTDFVTRKDGKAVDIEKEDHERVCTTSV